jgi:transposase
MENTGHYHYPVLKAFEDEGLSVCLINAYQMKKYGDTELRKAKTDKKDALRIARYALEKGYSLVPHTSMD